MLVPNSNTEYRALIGDRDADDTTDLSDNASEAEEEAEYKSDIKKVLDSKHVIGGKPKIEEILDYEPDSLTIVDGENIDKNNEYSDLKDNIVDAINNEINDNVKNNSDNRTDEKDSVLILGIDSGPLSTAEFCLKEDIHRTLLNGNVDEYARDFDLQVNGDTGKDVVDSISSYKGKLMTINIMILRLLKILEVKKICAIYASHLVHLQRSGTGRRSIFLYQLTTMRYTYSKA